jgi:hypothetical protein
MTVSRRFPMFAITFAVVYAILYAVAVDRNWALFSYHPALGTFGVLTTAAKAGPTMFWYGWMATAALGAALAGVLVSVLPEGLTRRLWPCLAWAVPMGAMVFFAFLLRGFFTR